MTKFLSLLVSGALVFSTAAPTLAAERAIGIDAKAPAILPVVTVNTQVSPTVSVGLDALSTLPALNSIDAGAIDAAASIAAPSVNAPGAELLAPAIPQMNGPAPDLGAAIQASAEDAQAEAGVGARPQLERVESAALTGDKFSQDRAWSGLRDAVAGDGVPVLRSGPVSRFSALKRAGTFAANAGVAAAVALSPSIALADTGVKTAAAAPVALPVWLQHLATQYQPYLTAGVSIAGIYGVHKGVSWLVGKIATWRGADEDGKKTAQLVSSLIVWGVGALAALHFGGAPAWVTEGAASLLPAGATIASRHLIGNALEASKVLFYHSFVIGDRIKIGADTYKVVDLSLTEVILQNEAYPNGSPTSFTYLQLSGKVMTVLHPYEANHKLVLEKPKVGVGEIGGLVWKTLGSAQRKTWLWLAGGVAAAVAASYAAPLVLTSSFLLTLLTIAKGAGIFVAAHNTRTLILDFIQRLGEKAGWHPQTIRVSKFVAEVLSYSIGGSWALGAAGTSVSAMLKGGLTTGLAFTLVTQDILSNLLQAFRLKRQRINGRKAFKIGDWVLTNGVLGKVVDMNFQYVVLAHEDGTHSLISYAILKDTEFTSFTNEADLAIAKKKFPPPSVPAPAVTPVQAAPQETK